MKTSGYKKLIRSSVNKIFSHAFRAGFYVFVKEEKVGFFFRLEKPGTEVFKNLAHRGEGVTLTKFSQGSMPYKFSLYATYSSEQNRHIVASKNAPKSDGIL